MIIKITLIKNILLTIFNKNLVNSKKFLNLNLPSTQMHNFHLLEEQRIYYNTKSNIDSNLYTSGFSTAIPFYFSTVIFCFCFFFVNYLWGGSLYGEIFSDDDCPAKNNL